MSRQPAASLPPSRALALEPGVDVQVEVETLDQLHEAISAGATSILLDNFTLERMREAVALTAGRALLEVSGGVTLDGSVRSPRPAWTGSRSAR